jgi:transcriptional regulator with XRE-family HTH domain
VSKGAPDKVDAEVARRIRTHRVSKGVSQMELGTAVGVTFQQIQKYEKGVNRVSPGRLQRIANHLGIPVATFYASLDRRSDNGGGEFYDLVQTAGAIKLLRDYNALKPNMQKSVVDMVGAIAAERENRREKRKDNGNPADRREGKS